MHVTALQERVAVITLAEAGHPDSDIAQRLGYRPATIRKWRRRGQRHGRQGLASQMGRPSAGSLVSFPWVVVEALRTRRQSHPRWGPKTLLAELRADRSLTGLPVPTRATIARWLKEQGLVRTYERHRELPQPKLVLARSPHEEWELDARGYEYVPQVGVITLINASDRVSKAKLISYPCWLGEQRASRHPTTADYQLGLRLAFGRWGLPDRLAVDRDSVFYDNLTKSRFPTRFHLWLLALGVALIFGPPSRPTERGMVERSHQTWDQQVLDEQSFVNWQALWEALQRRLDFLNEQLPCATLAEKPPLLAYPQARQPRRPYQPRWEAELLDLSRVYDYLRQGQWFRRTSNVGAVSLGDHIYILGSRWIKQQVEITFDPADQHLVFHSEDRTRERRLPIKGITTTDLMGEMGPLVNLGQVQLALPFSPQDWRVIRLCETLVS